eukprot:493472-Rhodomonas_salina.1
MMLQVVGLYRAFMAAGATAALVTLWSVNDQGTKDIMLALYRHLRTGLSLPQSLRMAMLDVSGRAKITHSVPLRSEEAAALQGQLALQEEQRVEQRVSQAGAAEDRAGANVCVPGPGSNRTGSELGSEAGQQRGEGAVHAKAEAGSDHDAAAATEEVRGRKSAR